MLKEWTTHADYQKHLSTELPLFCAMLPSRVYDFSDSIFKLSSLNLDPLMFFWNLTILSLADPLFINLKSFAPLFSCLNERKLALKNGLNKHNPIHFLLRLLVVSLTKCRHLVPTTILLIAYGFVILLLTVKTASARFDLIKNL